MNIDSKSRMTNLLYCALSGEIAQEPVVSSLTGHIYEKRLIEKHIKVSGTDPMNPDTPMYLEHIIPISIPAEQTKYMASPRTVESASIPQILKILQNEWDASMLELFNVKQQLQQTREQLSHSLYQHDAACRVIAKLMKERDEALSSLTKGQVSSKNVIEDEESVPSSPQHRK